MTASIGMTDRIEKLKNILKLSESYDSIVLLPHFEPDGDALGASGALALAFSKLGKEVKIVSDRPITSRYSYLSSFDQVLIYSGQEPGEFLTEHFGSSDDILAIYIDCSNPSRTGGAAELSPYFKQTAVIDHHNSENCLDDYCCIDKEACATGAIAFSMIELMEREYGLSLLDDDIVSHILSAIYFDTGGLRFSNTNVEAFAICHELFKNFDIDLRDIAYNLFERSSKAKMCIQSRAFASIEYLEDGQIALCPITAETISACNAVDDDMDGLSTSLKNIEGIKASFLLRDMEGQIRVSIRSIDLFDSSYFASLFGGGGHVRAAGFNLEGMSMEEVMVLVGEKARKRLQEVEDKFTK